MKVLHSQEQNVIHQAIEPVTPMESNYINEHLPIFRDSDFDAQAEYVANARTNGRHPEIDRIETKFGIKIVSILAHERVNGHIKTMFLCDKGNVLEADVSNEAVRSIENVRVVTIPETTQAVAYDEGCNLGFIVTPQEGKCGCEEENCRHLRAVREAQPLTVRPAGKPRIKCLVDLTPKPKRLSNQQKESAFDRWVGGEYPVEAPIELALWKSENKDQLAKCCICGRTLTNPLSVALQIGPECRKQITMKGNTFIEDGKVTGALVSASEVYSDEKHRSRVIRACLMFEECEPPSEILHWRGEEYFGYKRKPFLYYHDIKGILHVLEIRRRTLNHRIISCCTCETELDSHAWRISQEMTAEGANNGIKRLEMDKNLQTWLVENGNRKEISCREICMEYDGKNVTRLRAEIDGGADIATVELPTGERIGSEV